MQAMARKRNGLVPIGKAFAGRGGPVEALRESSPQARHHFTQADQVNQLVSGQRSGPRHGLHGAADGAVQPAPHQPRQPASERVHVRRDGKNKLGMTAGVEHRTGKASPSGILPSKPAIPPTHQLRVCTNSPRMPQSRERPAILRHKIRVSGAERACRRQGADWVFRLELRNSVRGCFAQIPVDLRGEFSTHKQPFTIQVVRPHRRFLVVGATTPVNKSSD